MSDSSGDRHWLVRPATVRRLCAASAVVLALTLVAQLAVDVPARFGADGWFGFGAAYGFGACVLMVVLARALGLLLKRAENYYDD